MEAFGTEVLLENGDINRKVLGDLIFNQPDRRHLLNTITHPEIRKEMMKETFKYFLRGEAQGLGQGWAKPSSYRARGLHCRKVGQGGGELDIQAVGFTLFIGNPSPMQSPVPAPEERSICPSTLKEIDSLMRRDT